MPPSAATAPDPIDDALDQGLADYDANRDAGAPSLGPADRTGPDPGGAADPAGPVGGALPPPEQGTPPEPTAAAPAIPGPAPAAVPPPPAARAGKVDPERAAIEAQSAAGEKEAQAAERAGAAEADARSGTADARQKAVDDMRARQAQRDTFEAAQDQARAKLTAIQERAQQQVDSFQFHDWFSSKTTGKKIGTLLLAVGAGLGGNDVSGMVEKKIAHDFEQQRAELTKRENIVGARRQGVKDFDEYLHEQRTALDLKESNAKLAAAQELEATADRLGAKADRVKVAQTAAKLRADAAAQQERAEHGYAEGQTQREHYRAEEALANAHLGLEREQVQATRDLKKQALGDKEDAEVVRNEAGQPIGRVPTGRGGAAAFSTRDADYGRAIQQLEALQQDVQQNGGRVLLPDAAKRRSTLHKNAVIGIGTVSPLGKTNESMEAEAGSIGASGAYTALGANPDAIQRKINEVKEQRERYRQQTLRPISGEGAIRSTAGAAPPLPTEPPQFSGDAGPSKAEKFTLKKFVNANSGSKDPAILAKVAAARGLLGQ